MICQPLLLLVAWHISSFKTYTRTRYKYRNTCYKPLLIGNKNKICVIDITTAGHVIVLLHKEHYMNNKKYAMCLLTIPFLTTALTSCGGNQFQPLWNEEADSEKLVSVVISDIHLGVDDVFAENSKNKGLTADFFNRASVTSSIDEIVIDGDFLDGWFLPTSYGTIRNYSELYTRVASNNKEIITAIQRCIANGKKVVYVPGNHDMTLSHDILASIIPGITQIRDEDGLGTYRTGYRSEVAIEHGHRYNVFCAPDPLSNAVVGINSILPAGYFYTRLATEWVVEGHPTNQIAVPNVDEPSALDVDQMGAYAYYQMWKNVIGQFGVNKTMEDKFLPVGVDGFDDYYSLADVVPTMKDGKIQAKLFPDIQARWNELQIKNRVNKPYDFIEAITNADNSDWCDETAIEQHFDIEKSTDVVVFGHTHNPKFWNNIEGYPGKTYINTGTWIDKNNVDAQKRTRQFAKIVSSNEETISALLQYQADGTIIDISNDCK